MRLAHRTWGSGNRRAVLVHGYSDDARTWWRVGPALAERGWTVVAPDLRGHGQSARSDDYALDDFADDLAESLEPGADLVLGHSLGAVALGLAAPRLAAHRTVFVDPAWLNRTVHTGLDRPLARDRSTLPPRWDAGDVRAELSSNARVDPRVAAQLVRALAAGPLVPPRAPEPGAVVLVPEHDPVLPPAAHPALRALGYRVVTQPGVAHVVHRDDPDGFLRVLDEQLLAAL